MSEILQKKKQQRSNARSSATTISATSRSNVTSLRQPDAVSRSTRRLIKEAGS